jgi:primosomal protein N' (replication factor Y)
VRLEIRDQDAGRAEAEARKMAEKLSALIQSEKRRETNLIGPVPAFFSKLDGVYRWQVILRGPDPVSLLRGRIHDNWRIEVEPISLL